MQINDEIDAVFSPMRRENLSPGAFQDIGKVGRFVAAWQIAPGEAYAGQFAMTPVGDLFHFPWCPEEDLQPV